MSLPASILIYGHDPMLLDTRSCVLQTAGFQVFTVAELANAAKTMTHQPIDLLLLCHTLTAVERQAAISTARTAQPQIKQLVMITNAQEAGQEKIEGETLHLFAGASGLIAAVQKTLDSTHSC